jgi:hypothetical protein
MRHSGTAKPLEIKGVRPEIIAAVELELQEWREVYDRFGEAHVRRISKEGISPKKEVHV